MVISWFILPSMGISGLRSHVAVSIMCISVYLGLSRTAVFRVRFTDPGVGVRNL